MKTAVLQDRNPVARLRLFIVLFFTAILVPLSVIVFFGYQQFENEMYFQYRWNSENAVSQINKTLSMRLASEAMRPADHYSFYRYVANPVEMGGGREVSPLANPETYATDIGLIGYFSITPEGELKIPLLPYQTSEEITAAKVEMQWGEVEQRLMVREALKKILVDGGLLAASTAAPESGGKSSGWQPLRVKDGDQHSDAQQVDAFQILRTEGDKLIFYRNVWIEKMRSIQGFVVNWDAYFYPVMRNFVDLGFYENCVQVKFTDAYSNAHYFRYQVDANGVVSVSEFDEPNPDLEVQNLHEGNLVSPFAELSLRFSTDKLPMGPASELVTYVLLVLLVLLVVIVGGCIGFYRLGLRQIALAEQRMNFVSSVSHELKTPLTSILMYSEMLKSGMVQSDETQLDYHKFIYSESSRLSRLINNILQLSSFSRQENALQPEYVGVQVLEDTIRSKLSSMMEENDFKLNFLALAEISEQAEEVEVCVDLDAFTQIVINLADNAVKFFGAAKIEDQVRRKIDIAFAFDAQATNRLIFSLRDYGPGISEKQSEKIFELFYRCGNEMTRTTPGTGIGLALVNELVLAQGGQIDVKRLKQGVSFEITLDFRLAKTSGR